ncbi:MAG: hypothetical protein ACLP01_26815 [Solirubrobacteraceae bacterium]
MNVPLKYVKTSSGAILEFRALNLLPVIAIAWPPLMPAPNRWRPLKALQRELPV